MAVFDLRNAPRDERGIVAAGQGGGYSTSQNHNSLKTLQHAPLAPEHIRDRIYKVVGASERAVSRAEIAKALGLKKTPWLNAAIEGLVTDGYLTREHIIRSNGVVMYYYGIAL